MVKILVSIFILIAGVAGFFSLYNFGLPFPVALVGGVAIALIINFSDSILDKIIRGGLGNTPDH